MRWLSIAVPAAVARVYCATEIRLCQAGSNGASDGELVRVGNHQSRSGRDGHCRCCGRHGMRFQMKSSSHCSFLTPAIRPPAHSPAVPAQSVPFKDTVYDHRVAQIVNAWAGFAFQPGTTYDVCKQPGDPSWRGAGTALFVPEQGGVRSLLCADPTPCNDIGPKLTTTLSGSGRIRVLKNFVCRTVMVPSPRLTSPRSSLANSPRRRPAQ